MYRSLLVCLLLAVAVTAGPLHDAILTGDEQKVLTETDWSKADVSEQADVSITSQILAAMKESEEVEGVATTLKNATLLHVAAIAGWADVAKKLVELGARVDAHAGMDGYMEYEAFTPLHAAALWGATKVVDVLLAAHANPNEEALPTDFTALVFAADRGYAAIASALVKAGAKLQGDGDAPIHFAALNGHVDVVTLLLDAGANVNFQAHNGQGDTALHAAAMIGNKAMVQLLVERGALSIASSDGVTPLDLAREGEFKDVADFLLEKFGESEHPADAQDDLPEGENGGEEYADTVKDVEDFLREHEFDEGADVDSDTDAPPADVEGAEAD